jgi:hypothetical protein
MKSVMVRALVTAEGSALVMALKSAQVMAKGLAEV